MVRGDPAVPDPVKGALAVTDERKVGVVQVGAPEPPEIRYWPEVPVAEMANELAPE